MPSFILLIMNIHTFDYRNTSGLITGVLPQTALGVQGIRVYAP